MERHAASATAELFINQIFHVEVRRGSVRARLLNELLRSCLLHDAERYLLAVAKFLVSDTDWLPVVTS